MRSQFKNDDERRRRFPNTNLRYEEGESNATTNPSEYYAENSYRTWRRGGIEARRSIEHADAAHQSRMQVLLRVRRKSITRLRLRERIPGSKKKQIWSRRLLLRVASRVHLGTETESAYKGGTLNIGIGSVDLTRLINTGPDLILDRANSPNSFLTRYFAYKPHSLGLHPSWSSDSALGLGSQARNPLLSTPPVPGSTPCFI